MSSVDPVIALEENMWSMFSVLGRGNGGHVVDTPTRLIVEAPIPQPPYNGVWRFHDDGSSPLRDQVQQTLAPFRQRGVEVM